MEEERYICFISKSIQLKKDLESLDIKSIEYKIKSFELRAVNDLLNMHKETKLI